MLRRSVARAIRHYNLPVDLLASAENGSQLLEAVLQHQPQAVLTDFHMRDGGLPMLEALSFSAPDVRLYVMSGGWDGRGFSGYFEQLFRKPFDVRQVIKQIVREVLDVEGTEPESS